jgi:hypothetical protein
MRIRTAGWTQLGTFAAAGDDGKRYDVRVEGERKEVFEVSPAGAWVPIDGFSSRRMWLMDGRQVYGHPDADDTFVISKTTIKLTPISPVPSLR